MEHAEQKVIPLPVSPELGVKSAVSAPAMGSSESLTACLLIKRARS